MFTEPHSLMGYIRLREMQILFLLFINYDQPNLRGKGIKTSTQLINLLIIFF